MSPSSQPPTDRELHDIFRAVRAWMDATYPDHAGVEILVHHVGRKSTRIAVPSSTPRPPTLLNGRASCWRHSPDYRDVHWHGHRFQFSKTQAAVVEILDQAKREGVFSVPQNTIIQQIGSQAPRLSEVFRKGRDGNRAWGLLIVQDPDLPCNYRLADHPPDDTDS